MISAFGIEHIEKSYVSGKGFVPAKDLTSGMKSLIRTRVKNKGKGPGGIHTPGRKVEGESSKGRQIYDDMETRSLNRKVTTDVLGGKDAAAKPGQVILGHSKPNGRGGGILRMNTSADEATQRVTYKHEMAHLKPKRNPVRFSERTSESSTRLGREEGRADFIGNGKRTPGSYPGDRQFQRGYNEVQNKMHASRKPRKFAVDRKGAAVEKSAFGLTHKLPTAIKLKRGQVAQLQNKGKGTVVRRPDVVRR